MVRSVLILGIICMVMLPLVYAGELQQEMIITSCGVLDQPNTIYYLQNDISDSDFMGNTCFTITAPHVTLECTHHTIGADTTTGVALFTTQPASEIINCGIKMKAPGSYGILAGGAENIHVSHTNIAYTDYPIMLVDTTNGQISAVAIDRAVKGLELRRTTGILVQEAQLTNVENAVTLHESNNNKLENIVVDTCTAPTGCVVFNAAQDNAFMGVRVTNPFHATFSVDGTNTYNSIADALIMKSSEEDVVLTGTDNRLVLLNSTYDAAKERVERGNNLTRSWFLSTHITTPADQPLADAAIEGIPTPEGDAFTLITDSEGNARRTVIGYQRTGEESTPVTYLLRITHPAFLTYESSFTFDDNRELTQALTVPETSTPETPPANEGGRCRSPWTCTEWSACTNGQQTRSCSLQNANCLPLSGQRTPLESQTCQSLEALAVPASAAEGTETTSFVSRITGAVIGANRAMGGGLAFIGLLAVVGAGYIGVGIARRRFKK